MTGPARAMDERLRRFRDAYGRHRAAEGRGAEAAQLLDLPFVRRGPLARQWRVRARTFRHFVRTVLDVRAAEVAPRPLRVADLGAGNGWLCYRVALRGHDGVAVDLRDDDVDGLAAAAMYTRNLRRPFTRVVASFEALPLAGQSCDIAVFDASLHYALDLRAALAEAARIVVPRGRIAILDSPFYATEEAGHAMVEEKHRDGAARFGALAGDLLDLPFIEFLTRDRLARASADLRLRWRHHRVRYPPWYEARPAIARVRGRRSPSRFDLWEALVP